MMIDYIAKTIRNFKVLCVPILYLVLMGQASITKADFSIETNTTPFLFGGYALGFSYQPTEFKHLSILVGHAGDADFDQWIIDAFKPQNKNKGIDWEVEKAFVFSIDYFPDESQTGTYFGLFSFFFENRLSRFNETVTLNTHNALLRMGYRFFLDSIKFYLSPWAGIGSEYETGGQATISDQTWEVSDFAYFVSLNIGLRL